MGLFKNILGFQVPTLSAVEVTYHVMPWWDVNPELVQFDHPAKAFFFKIALAVGVNLGSCGFRLFSLTSSVSDQSPTAPPLAFILFYKACPELPFPPT